MAEQHNPVKHDQRTHHEHQPSSKEQLAKLERSHTEKVAEHSSSKHSQEVDQARHEAQEAAVSAAEYAPTSGEQTAVNEPTTKKTKEHAFNTTMHHVRSQMRKPEQMFSSFIHKPVVEKTSEVLGKTVARPSGVIGAAIAAFIGLLSVYSIAKFAGFQLSGSEMPLLLASGFVLGLLIEWSSKSVRSILAKRST